MDSSLRQRGLRRGTQCPLTSAVRPRHRQGLGMDGSAGDWDRARRSEHVDRRPLAAKFQRHHPEVPNWPRAVRVASAIERKRHARVRGNLGHGGAVDEF